MRLISNDFQALATKRFLPTLAISLLLYQVLLTSLSGHYAAWLMLSSLTGMIGAVYLHIEWKRGRMSSTELVVWSGALPLCFALFGVYLLSTLT